MEASEPINLFTCLSIDPLYQAMDEPQNASKTFSWILFRDRIKFPKDYSNICYSCCTICLRTKEHHNLKFSSNHHISRGRCSCVIVFVLIKYMWVGTWRKKKENNQHGFFACNVGTHLILVFVNFFFIGFTVSKEPAMKEKKWTWNWKIIFGLDFIGIKSLVIRHICFSM